MRSGQKIVKSRVRANTHGMSGHSQDSKDESCPGEFDSNENKDLLKKVKASKHTMTIASTGGPARYI